MLKTPCALCLSLSPGGSPHVEPSYGSTVIFDLLPQVVTSACALGAVVTTYGPGHLSRVVCYTVTKISERSSLLGAFRRWAHTAGWCRAVLCG